MLERQDKDKRNDDDFEGLCENDEYGTRIQWIPNTIYRGSYQVSRRILGEADEDRSHFQFLQ